MKNPVLNVLRPDALKLLEEMDRASNDPTKAVKELAFWLGSLDPERVSRMACTELIEMMDVRRRELWEQIQRIDDLSD